MSSLKPSRHYRNILEVPWTYDHQGLCGNGQQCLEPVPVFSLAAIGRVCLHGVWGGEAGGVWGGEAGGVWGGEAGGVWGGEADGVWGGEADGVWGGVFPDNPPAQGSCCHDNCFSE